MVILCKINLIRLFYIPIWLYWIDKLNKFIQHSNMAISCL
uniref:Uncharacterized protein n=1 Tax=Siphoviridae sp. ct7EW56 TaxID=2827562 RepID=A0A8S5LSB1_9CAUD|nr:MAG TPA: hypothetical protein [Siphoviridae sp. ct7EW56]